MNTGRSAGTVAARTAEAAARRPSGGGDSEAVTLDLLQAVEEDARHSQRSLAASMNVALGLTNAYLRRCVRKGWIKVQQIPPNRFAYFLTPKGMSEKTRLAAQLLYNSFTWYRAARDQYDALIEQAASRGLRRLALAGGGDLAEVALLCAMRYEVEVVGVVDAGVRDNRFRHVALAGDLDSLPRVDAVLLTDMAAPQATYELMAGRLGAERVLAPQLLRVKPVARPAGQPVETGR